MPATTAQGRRDEGIGGVLRRGDLLVPALGLLILCAGWLVRSSQIDRTTEHRFEDLSLHAPASWISLPGPKGRLVLTDVVVPDTFKPRISVFAERLPAGFRPAELRGYVELNLQRRLDLFHLVAASQTGLAGRRAMRLDYAYAVNPGARADDPAATDVPVAVRASTLAVLVGERLLRVEVKQSVAQHRAAPGLADAVLGSVQLEAGR